MPRLGNPLVAELQLPVFETATLTTLLTVEPIVTCSGRKQPSGSAEGTTMLYWSSPAYPGAQPA